MFARIRTGLWWGIAFSAAYIVLVLLIAAFRGSGSFERSGTTLGSVILAYAAAGIVGGLVFGLLLPLGRKRAGAALLGFIVAVPVVHVIGLAVDASALYDTSRVFITLVAALLLGPASGIGLWYVNDRL